MPKIASGEAFPQTEMPNTPLMNLSVYGETVRLRGLLAAWFGLNWFGPGVGKAIASIYGIVVVLLAAAAGWLARERGWLAKEAGTGVRDREPQSIAPETRIRLAQLVLALLSLMAFRSPFVGSLYGYLGTLWLLTLLAAGASTPMRRGGWLAGFGTGRGHLGADANGASAAGGDSPGAGMDGGDERGVLVCPATESRRGRARPGGRVEARIRRCAARRGRGGARRARCGAGSAAVQQAVDPVSELVVQPHADGDHGRGAHDEGGGDYAHLDDFKLHPPSISDFTACGSPLDNTHISAYNPPMRRKAGTLVPLEVAICVCAVELRRQEIVEFHGYEMARRLGDAGDQKLLTAYGTLYRALSRLEQMGMLESHWEDPAIPARENRPGRRLYTLTAAGEAAVREAAMRETEQAAARRGWAPGKRPGRKVGPGMTLPSSRSPCSPSPVLRRSASPPRSSAPGPTPTPGAWNQLSATRGARRSNRICGSSSTDSRTRHGQHPAAHVIARLLIGIPDDLSWRAEHAVRASHALSARASASSPGPWPRSSWPRPLDPPADDRVGAAAATASHAF